MKKLLALILAMLMVMALFAGCTNGGNGGNEPAANNGGDTATETDDFSWPLVDAEELSIWNTFSTSANTIVDTKADTEYYKELQRRLNVNIKWLEVSSATSTEAFSLMLTENDLPDLINVPAAGLPALGNSGDAAIENDVAIDLTPYSAYFPNYAAARQVNDIVRKETTTDNGKIWAFITILQKPEGAWAGLGFRKDLAENAGYTGKPETIGDWEQMLTAMKNAGVPTPLALPADMLTGAYVAFPFLYTYNLSADWIVKDGKVTSVFTEPGMKDYIAQFADWYQKGLVDNEFTSRNANAFGLIGTDNTNWYFDDLGSFVYVYSFTRDSVVTSYQKPVADTFWLEAVHAPTVNAGDTLHVGFPMIYTTNSGTGMIISTSCQKVELACRFMDYFYTDEGFMLNNYGIEGLSYTMIDGKPESTDAVMHDPDGRPFDAMIDLYAWTRAGFGLYTYEYSASQYVDKRVFDAYDEWDFGDYAYLYPTGATMTDTESASYSSAYSDIQTYAQETLPKFVMGALSMSEWDSFVNQIQNMGVDRCIAAKQAAYDRYESK